MGYAVMERVEGRARSQVDLLDGGFAHAVREAREWYRVGSSISNSNDAAPNNTEELDALEDLGDEIAVLSAHIHAATHQLLTLIAEFDRREGWKTGEYRNCAHWLSVRTGIDQGAARQKVRVALALESLPKISASMAQGELSFSKVRALVRVANAENEDDLLEFARTNTAAHLEKLVRGWKDLSREDEAARERRRHASRSFSVFPDENGMYMVRGTLDPEVGAALMRAVEEASDALYRAESNRSPLEPEIEPQQRRADAVGLLAERAMAAGFGGNETSGSETGGTETSGAGEDEPGGDKTGRDKTSRDETSGDEPGGSETPLSGSRAERYQVMLMIDPDTLSATRESGRSHLDDGTRVSAETSRRLCCDASVIPVKLSAAGEVLDVGRKTRTIPPAIRRALEVRDEGCRFPGCGLRFTDGHHVVHWADGGETKLSNLVLLCRFHHRAVHEDGFSVRFQRPGEPKFFTPEGLPLGNTRPCVRVNEGDPAVALIRRNRKRGVKPHARMGAAMYEREASIPDTLLFRAFEAVDRA